MGGLRRLTSTIGLVGLVVVLVTPVVAALLAAVMAPRFVHADQRASAQVALFPVTGTHAAYDLASYVADFQQALRAPAATEAARKASGSSPAVVDAGLSSTRLGDSTKVLVSFAAPTREAAERGLKAATGQALTAMVADERTRAGLELEASVQQLAAARRSAIPGVPDDVAAQSTQTLVQRALDSVATAQTRVVLAETVGRSLDDLVEGQVVSVEELSTLQDRIRLVVAAAASSFVLALVAIGLLARRDGAAKRVAPAPRPAHLEKHYQASA